MIPIRNKKKTLKVTVEEMRNFAFVYVEKDAPHKQKLKTNLLKKDKLEKDFVDLIIKGSDSKGNIVTNDSIRKVSYKSKASNSEKIKKIDQIEVKDEEQVSNASDETQTKLEF